MPEQEYFLVSAPTKAGEAFIKSLNARRIPVAAIINNKFELEHLINLGVERIIKVNTNEEQTWIIPDFPVGKVFLFERSLPLCCRYIQICRSWTTKPIYVITENKNPRLVYKGLGANYVIHSSGNDLSFLIQDLTR